MVGTERIALNSVGEVTVLGLEAISESYGRDFMPHPFTHTQPSPFRNFDEYAESAADTVDRFNHGDLQVLGQWFTSYMRADIRVECVSDAAGQKRMRLVAHRSDQLGFFAAQLPDKDLVKVYSLSPYDLGAAIVAWVSTTQPGKHPQLRVPGLTRQSLAPHGNDSPGVSVRQRAAVSPGTGSAVPETAMVKFTLVQSHWQPPRDWGFDHRKNAVVWVQFEDDGDYLYRPERGYFQPVTAAALRRRVDEHIAADVAVIRENRGR